MKKVIFCLMACALFLVGSFDVYAADSCLLKVNTEGLGQIKIAAENEEVEFDDDFPTQSAFENTVVGTKFKVGAKADDGWTFAKWKLDGDDYSEEEIITVEIDKDMELIAVFEPVDDGTDQFVDDSVTQEDNSANNNDKIFMYIGIGIGVVAVLLISVLVVLLLRKKR